MSYTQIETAIFEGTPAPTHAAGDDEDYTYDAPQTVAIRREELDALRQRIQEAEKLAADRNKIIASLYHERDGERIAGWRVQERVAELEQRAATLEAAIWQMCRDWSAAPREAQWWAADCDGQVYWYECEPTRGEMGVWKSHIRGGVWVGGVCPLAALGIDWSDTLTQRPTEAQP